MVYLRQVGLCIVLLYLIYLLEIVFKFMIFIYLFFTIYI